MNIKQLIDAGSVVMDVSARDRRGVVEDLCRRAAGRFGLNEGDVFDVIWEREGLGSTGLGDGVAVPHGRVSGVEAPTAYLAVLPHPVDFAAPDGKPVDIVFLLLAAEGAGADHLDSLSAIAEIAKDGKKVEGLRAAKTSDAAYKALSK